MDNKWFSTIYFFFNFFLMISSMYKILTSLVKFILPWNYDNYNFSFNFIFICLLFVCGKANNFVCYFVFWKYAEFISSNKFLMVFMVSCI